ncbi:BTB/POZ domain-containing protein At3g22104-like isoform X1 [Rhododendron vialii]|uniref:BTB/POZ domain-containing protein At3g22104-like isoform X1 n=2 Tax=Rhododendron vialii TaxID=182163 RepID=UPI00265DCC18|nr:BTB/POZ domain-containing protein At3g22104-like isoform X1 [Rhododendron vialii]
MVVCCDLEVEVNGEEIFVLDKKTISFYSGRLSKLIGKSRIETQGLKVIFHDFPGGAESFELMTRFCYNSGKLQINPLNLTPLHCVAHFMEMNKTASGSLNLLERTEKSLEEIRYWTWSELLVALKQCQDLLPVANSCNVLEIYLDSLVGRLSLASETSPCPSTSSPDSFDTQSYESLKSSSFRATWWFEDLVALNPYLIEMVTKSMVSWKFDHATISRFLFYYQKSRFIRATSDEKRVIAETVVNMLSLLDWSAISCKSLFGILRVALSLNISKLVRYKLESMIGSQMDQATLDNLLVPPQAGVNYLYDVNLVLSFVKSFVGQGLCCVPLVRLKKVAGLMDLYIAEVAPDPCLKPSKFLYLVTALPDYARENYDAIYHAMDMYLEVHAALSEEEKVNVCYGLNYEKLSSEVYKHLTQNKKFPSKSAVQTLISPQCNLKSLRGGTDHREPFIDSSRSFAEIDIKGKKDEACEQIVLYARKLDLPAENEKLRANLQGMQWRVAELEKLRAKMQNQMTKMLKSRSSSHRNGRSLPRLCS